MKLSGKWIIYALAATTACAIDEGNDKTRSAKFVQSPRAQRNVDAIHGNQGRRDLVTDLDSFFGEPEQKSVSATPEKTTTTKNTQPGFAGGRYYYKKTAAFRPAA
mmetsp:Transcript_16955/g.38959  ORF Transcript_16955/g.38959 Transcript_16955/m.38959 type:complete len:105 (-) Transcript_16955:1633-1947(-)